MSKAYLKYYFAYKNGKLLLDSLACIEGEVISEPDNFVRWYEDGDLEFEYKGDALNSESPVFSAIFGGLWKTTFKLEDYLEVERSGDEALVS